MKLMGKFRMWLFCALVAGVVSSLGACSKEPAAGNTEPAAAAPLQQPTTIAVPGAPGGTDATAAAVPAIAAVPLAKGTAAAPEAIPSAKVPVAGTPSADKAGVPETSIKDAPAAQTTLADPMFTIRLTAAPTVAPGGTAKAQVTVLPGKGYKINKEFPANLQMEALTGVTFSPAKLERAAAKVDTDHELTFEVQMSAAVAGDFNTKGLLKFAVCDDANCVPKKQAFAVDLHVK